MEYIAIDKAPQQNLSRSNSIEVFSCTPGMCMSRYIRGSLRSMLLQAPHLTKTVVGYSARRPG